MLLNMPLDCLKVTDNTKRTSTRTGTVRTYVAALALLSIFTACHATKREYTVTEPKMGTLVQITVYDSDEDHAIKAIRKAFSEIDRVENLTSIWKPNSEVSRINREAFFNPTPVSPEVYDLIKRSINLCHLTSGAFDITVGPLLKLWPLYRANKILPSDEEIRKALKLVGCDNIELVDGNHCIRFKKAGMSIDLGGIAKGYAVAKAIETIKKEGIENALVDAGGDLYALGTHPDGAPWHVGIRHPRKPSSIIAVLNIRDLAVVTSGDYERYFIKNGRRYSHIIDPRSGFPAHGMISVTITARDPAMADAIATSVLVLGAKRGMKLIEKLPGIEGLIISRGPKGHLQVRWSSGMRRFLRTDET